MTNMLILQVGLFHPRFLLPSFLSQKSFLFFVPVCILADFFAKFYMGESVSFTIDSLISKSDKLDLELLQ